MTQVPFALSFAGYSFEKDLLNELFGSSSVRALARGKNNHSRYTKILMEDNGNETNDM